MNASPWYFRFFVILFVLMVAKTSPPLALTLIGAAAVIAVGALLHRTGRLPRLIMDVLDRLTDRGALERSYEREQSRLSVIDAAMNSTG